MSISDEKEAMRPYEDTYESVSYMPASIHYVNERSYKCDDVLIKKIQIDLFCIIYKTWKITMAHILL